MRAGWPRKANCGWAPVPLARQSLPGEQVGARRVFPLVFCFDFGWVWFGLVWFDLTKTWLGLGWFYLIRFSRVLFLFLLMFGLVLYTCVLRVREGNPEGRRVLSEYACTTVVENDVFFRFLYNDIQYTSYQFILTKVASIVSYC